MGQCCGRFSNPVQRRSFVAAEGCFVGSGFKFSLINVYGPQEGAAKLALLDDLIEETSF